MDIGESFKISSIKLPDNVVPTIQGRDFVVATLAAPTIIKEPEKPAETEEGTEGTDATATEGTEGETKTAVDAEGDKKEGDKTDKKTNKKEGEDKKPAAKAAPEKK
jgi:large subunit ribosomal protein L25